ncbi:hypothetical protein FGO68_gene5713 [Halteria grandinella]|uniref:Uncharacterized protein n=1 Tax=Halteria grandinella TaxID=5974 RepID=A0A8J8TA43_HALGN|nr:hypothetical protein FGO68_gene5713 [Halteria grandinella]
MLWKISGFASGAALGATFIVTMDDMIYTQLRRNVIMPVQQVFTGVKTGSGANLDEILAVASGTGAFVSQFKPHALGRSGAKELVLNDQDYATPNDHYFGYIHKRQTVTAQNEQQQQVDILKSLGMEVLMPPTFNVETGLFEEPKILDSQGRVVNEEEMDVFELARIRGTTVGKLRQMKTEHERKNIDETRQVNISGQKHQKKDYERLKDLNMHDIVMKSKRDSVKKAFQDDTISHEIVKIEKKKGFKRSSDQRQRDLEIQQVIKQSPQDINYEVAMKMYDEQGLEAKDISEKDRKRLRRLRRKAEKENRKQAEAQLIADGVPEVEKASAIKIESVDELIK